MRRPVVASFAFVLLAGCAGYQSKRDWWYNLAIGHAKSTTADRQHAACVKGQQRSPHYKTMLRACYESCASDVSAHSVGADGDGGAACAWTCALDLKYTACNSGAKLGSGLGPSPVEPHGFALCARGVDYYMSCDAALAFEHSGPCADPAFVAAAREFLKLPSRVERVCEP